MHLHANSMVSGVLYLTDVHDDARLVFHKPEGGQFVLSNSHAGVSLNQYNASRRQVGPTSAGDLILFPSHLLHSVPANPGTRRMTLAFNAIPSRINAWGYELALA
jgi:predicted 2-oxoglutarate/Fe(II)-dependent dioxygenase YbiX